MKISGFYLVTFLTAALAHAGPRTSANYSITTDSADRGGRRATSANYTNDGSAGEVAGISTVASPAETARHGYIGQLYEIPNLSIFGSPNAVNEGGTSQLSAQANLDDGTRILLTPAQVSWLVRSGPVYHISASGLASTAPTLSTTTAQLDGTYRNATDQFGGFILTVLNTGESDNFQSYAGDGIDDGWQVFYFGNPPNPNAGPNADFSGSGQTNLFKFIAGLIPTDPNSRFVLSIQPVLGQPGHKSLVFSPRFSGRTYTAKSKAALSIAAWSPLTNFTIGENGQQRTVTDQNASGAVKFYHVEITRP